MALKHEHIQHASESFILSLAYWPSLVPPTLSKVQAQDSGWKKGHLSQMTQLATTRRGSDMSTVNEQRDVGDIHPPVLRHVRKVLFREYFGFHLMLKLISYYTNFSKSVHPFSSSPNSYSQAFKIPLFSFSLSLSFSLPLLSQLSGLSIQIVVH